MSKCQFDVTFYLLCCHVPIKERLDRIITFVYTVQPITGLISSAAGLISLNAYTLHSGKVHESDFMLRHTQSVLLTDSSFCPTCTLIAIHNYAVLTV